MNRRDRAAWGAVGALSFLVLVQGYELAVGLPVGLWTKGGLALAVGVLTALLVAVLAARFDANESA